MPLRKKPQVPYTGAQLAFRAHEHAFRGLQEVKKTAHDIRREVLTARASDKEQEMSDALGTADLTALVAVYAALKAYAVACGDNCRTLPDLPTTTNP